VIIYQEQLFVFQKCFYLHTYKNLAHIFMLHEGGHYGIKIPYTLCGWSFKIEHYVRIILPTKHVTALQ